MGSERLVVVIQVLDYLKYSRGLNVSSLFSDFTYKSMELCHILVKDGLKWFAYCQRGQKDSHPQNTPKTLSFFALVECWNREGGKTKEAETCPLESPYRNPSRRFTFVLKNAVVSISAALLNTRVQIQIHVKVLVSPASIKLGFIMVKCRDTYSTPFPCYCSCWIR